LLEGPVPDGIQKINMGGVFPYHPNAIGFLWGEFWVTYRFLNVVTIEIAAVHWSPDSPRRGGEFMEI
jgi:hypothetical protein